MTLQLELGAETEPGSLERMLNNPQATDAEIIQTLVKEYFEKAYQIALQSKSNPQLARQAGCLALAQVVHQRQSYWGEPALDDWIHELVQHFVTIQRKSSRGLPVEAEIGNAEGVSPKTAVEQALAELRRRACRAGQVRKSLLSLLGLTVVVLLLWLAGINQLISIPNPFNRVRFTYPTLPCLAIPSIPSRKKPGSELRTSAQSWTLLPQQPSSLVKPYGCHLSSQACGKLFSPGGQPPRQHR